MILLVIFGFLSGYITNIGLTRLWAWAKDDTICKTCGLPKNQHRLIDHEIIRRDN